MNLERTGVTQAPNHAATGRAADARARSDAAPAAGPAGGLSFLSLLAACEPEPDCGSDAGGMLAGDAPTGAPTPDLLAVFDPGASLSQDLNRPLPDANLASTSLPALLPDPGALLAQSQIRGAEPSDIDAAAAFESSLPAVPGQAIQMPAIPIQPGLPAAPASADRQSRGVISATQVSVASAERNPAAAAPAIRTPGGPTASDRDDQRGASPITPELAARQASPLDNQAAAPESLPSTASTVNSAGARPSPLRINGEWLSAQQHASTISAAETVANARVAVPDSSPTAVLDAAGASGLERPAQRPARAASGVLSAGSWADYGAVNGGSGARPVFAPEPAAAVPEMIVAEKLNYWITRGVQSAELQLDAFGGGSVDVSIVLHGNEAMVEFRSDQPEARKLLQDAMPQLKDMLRGEGLLLSGGFVGTSGQQDPGAQGRRTASQATRTPIRIADTAEPGQPTAATRATGRAVDVFV